MTSENPENPVKGEQPAAHGDNKTTDHPQETKPTAPPIAAQSRTQPCAKHYEVTCNKKRDWIDKMTLWFEGFGLFVLTGVAHWTIILK